MVKRFSMPVLWISLTCIIILTGCHYAQAVTEHTQTPAEVTETAFQPILTIETAIPTATATAIPTATITPSPTPLPPTPTPSQTATPTWAYNQPGQVIAPILLYHHINGDSSESRYIVSIPAFHAQMQALYEQGYTAITISTFLDALIEGGDLPEKPVVITFDDGHQNVYENAFPIMKTYNFPGVFYIVANRINGSPEFVDIEQLSNLINAGWEIGCHGYSHLDITENHASASYEIGQSKSDLQTALGVDVKTFAYPYGKIDPYVAQVVNDSGYRAGIGLGTSITHTLNNLYYLQRIEVYGKYTLEQFITLLAPH